MKNALAMGSVVIGISLYRNGPIFWSSWKPDYILPALLFLLLASAVTWLRWDWAPYEAARRKTEREANGG